MRPQDTRIRIRAAATFTAAALATLLPSLPGSAQEAATLTLSRAAVLALDAHPSVGIARHELEAAEASAAEARAARLPSVMASGSFSRFQEPMVVAPFHGFDPSMPPDFDRSLVRGELGLSYTLFDGGARSSRIGRAEAGRRTARAGLEASRMDLLHGVVEGYLHVLTSQELVRAHARRTTALEEELARARRFFDEGAAPRLELLRARASLSQARADARSAEIRARVARRELARLTGLSEGAIATTVLTPPGDPPPPLADSASLPPVDDRASATDPAPPELEAARQRLAVAHEARGMARASWVPDLTAQAGFNEFGSGDGDFTGEWQAGLRISYALFTGGARGAANQRADAEVRRAREALALTRLRIRSEADRARSALDDAVARSKALEATVEQLREVARIEALALDAGSGVQRDLLAAEASLLQARAQLAEARNAAVVARASMARVRGELTLEWIRTNLTHEGPTTPGEETPR